MRHVSKTLFTKIRSCLAQGEEKEAVRLLTENGCSLAEARSFVRKLAEEQDFAENYIVYRLLETLSADHDDAIRLLQVYYGLDVDRAETLVDQLAEESDITFSNVKRVTDRLQPGPVAERPEPLPGPARTIESEVFGLLAEGRYEKACRRAAERMPATREEAEAYVSLLQERLYR